MEKEEKAKVVASVLGAEFFQFLAVLAILPRSIWNWKNRKKPFLPYRPRQNSKCAARNLINAVSQTDATTFAFASVSIILLWYQLSVTVSTCTVQSKALTDL